MGFGIYVQIPDVSGKYQTVRCAQIVNPMNPYYDCGMAGLGYSAAEFFWDFNSQTRSIWNALTGETKHLGKPIANKESWTNLLNQSKVVKLLTLLKKFDVNKLLLQNEYDLDDWILWLKKCLPRALEVVIRQGKGRIFIS